MGRTMARALQRGSSTAIASASSFQIQGFIRPGFHLREFSECSSTQLEDVAKLPDFEWRVRRAGCGCAGAKKRDCSFSVGRWRVANPPEALADEIRAYLARIGRRGGKARMQQVSSAEQAAYARAGWRGLTKKQRAK